MKRFGVIADCHLPVEADTVKEKVFDWALAEAVRLKLDCIIGAGDLTSCGSSAAAERIWQKLKATGIPFALTPGNADLRDSSEKKKAMPFLKTYDELPGFFLPDSSSRGLVFIDKAKLQNLPAGTVVVTHCPPECFSPGERQELQQLLNENRIALLIAGHFHIDRENGNEHLIRGLDPDKAAGGAPALTVFEEINGIWKRQTIPCPAADPRNWSEEQKNGFLQNLGVSGMSAPLECLEQAAARQIGIFEFRFNEANDCSRNRLQQGIRNWRENGGHTLSASLPVCTWRDGELFGGGRMRRAIALALEMECDCVRIKMPEISLKDLASKAIRERFAELCREMFLPLKQAHCRIAFDNARMPYRRWADENRPFGCLPTECIQWCDFMRRVLDWQDIGIQLDIGNARNNPPFSNRFTLSQWYRSTGKYCCGYTLHQVVRENLNEPMRGNFPLNSLFGRLISLSSFCMAWDEGTLNHAPMILEIKDQQGITCYDALKSALLNRHFS